MNLVPTTQELRLFYASLYRIPAGSLTMRKVLLLACLVSILPQPAWAQGKDDMQERLRALEERVRALEAEVQALKASQGTPAAVRAPSAAPPAAMVQAPAGAPGVPSGQLPIYGGPASTLAKVLNPDISIIGDFLGAVGHNRVQPVPTLEMHETELGLQAIVDPYARGDFFLTFGAEGVDLEEGYLTFTSLPGGFVAKVGKMRSSFGVVNTLHNHTLPWTDRPLVTESLVGGEDGISDAGLSLSRILPAPKEVFLEATAQVFRGDSGDVFQATHKGDVSVVGRLRGYRDLTESTNLDLGVSYARGHNDLGSAFITELYGLDATLRWKPLRRAIYHSFLLRSELVWSERAQFPATSRAFGFYTSGDYRLNRRWTAGGRYDRSDRARDASLADSGFSGVLTYWPSEYSQLRGQYRYMRYAEGRTGNELRFQFLFSLGAHGAHPF
jgi:hypothetical protein